MDNISKVDKLAGPNVSFIERFTVPCMQWRMLLSAHSTLICSEFVAVDPVKWHEMRGKSNYEYYPSQHCHPHTYVRTYLTIAAPSPISLSHHHHLSNYSAPSPISPSHHHHLHTYLTISPTPPTYVCTYLTISPPSHSIIIQRVLDYQGVNV